MGSGYDPGDRTSQMARMNCLTTPSPPSPQISPLCAASRGLTEPRVHSGVTLPLHEAARTLSAGQRSTRRNVPGYTREVAAVGGTAVGLAVPNLEVFVVELRQQSLPFCASLLSRR